MPALTVERIPLGAAPKDPAAALDDLCRRLGSGRGALLELEGMTVLGAAPFEVLSVRGGRAYSGKKPLPGNPFDALGRRLAAFRAQAPAFTTGALGWLSYDMARHLERLPAGAEAEEASLMLFDALIVCRGGRAELWAFGAGRKKAEAARSAVLAPTRVQGVSIGPLKGLLGRDGFMQGVRRLKQHIGAGDIFQGVLSERFTAPLSGAPAGVYRALRAASPTPFHFWVKEPSGDLIGASPERLVRVEDGRALNCPIAGTRPRGATPAQDKALERALRRSPKERAEHLMLVDLGRNDLGRVCAPGTVKVKTMMEVRRFSNVMHLVSEVEGRLEGGRSAWDCLKASFPAGTVSGAPKVRAMELIAGLEKRPRGFYAGAVLHADFSGNLESCLAIRTLRVSGGAVTLQAGAGVVADSSPEREYQEVVNKLAGLRRALGAA